jgi:hypothetical protein
MMFRESNGIKPDFFCQLRKFYHFGGFEGEIVLMKLRMTAQVVVCGFIEILIGRS